jgi:hypothetical protein
VLTVGTLA